MIATFNLFILMFTSLWLAGCAHQPREVMPSCTTQTSAQASAVCPLCPACKQILPEVEVPASPPFAASRWQALAGWPGNDGLALSLRALLISCQRLERQSAWQAACTSAQQLKTTDEASLRAWFEAHLTPWQLVNPDGSRTGLITGYYEPLLKASRKRQALYQQPIYAAPDDLIDVDLSSVYPELKHMRLRGRLQGNKLLPYWSRAEWEKQPEQKRSKVLAWADDAIDVFFLQIQGSGQLQLDDGSRIRVNYANQNGHPYRSIGRWLIDQGELKSGQASMQGIRNWVKNNPGRAQELLDTNPSYVFFRELPVVGDGPPGAMGLALTPERSIAIDPRTTPLGVPVWLATTYPNSEQPLTRLMLAQDTGGAIRGPVRADFYWGSGAEAGAQAGKMSQQGQMWVLLPNGMTPPALQAFEKQ